MVSQSGIATSLDTNILDNDISNVGLGIYQEDSFMSFNDVTIVGNKFVKIGGGGAITLDHPLRSSGSGITSLPRPRRPKI